MNPRCTPNRLGVGLLEVIICTALVAVMIVPIAGVIRSSSQAIVRSDGSVSTAAKLRRSLRWLSNTAGDGQVLAVRPRRLEIRMSSGDDATIYARRGTLWLDDGRNPIPLAEDVRDIRFVEHVQSSPPETRVGVSMRLRAVDPVTRSIVTVDGTIAIPPQL